MLPFVRSSWDRWCAVGICSFYRATHFSVARRDPRIVFIVSFVSAAGRSGGATAGVPHGSSDQRCHQQCQQCGVGWTYHHCHQHDGRSDIIQLHVHSMHHYLVVVCMVAQLHIDSLNCCSVVSLCLCSETTVVNGIVVDSTRIASTTVVDATSVVGTLSVGNQLRVRRNLQVFNRFMHSHPSTSFCSLGDLGHDSRPTRVFLGVFHVCRGFHAQCRFQFHELFVGPIEIYRFGIHGGGVGGHCLFDHWHFHVRGACGLWFMVLCGYSCG